MNRYFYMIDDVVFHSEHNVKGKIISQITSDDGGFRVHEQDPSNPWYEIEWTEQDGSTWIGFEHQGSLIPEWTNMRPTLYVIHLSSHNKDQHKEFMDFCKTLK